MYWAKYQKVLTDVHMIEIKKEIEFNKPLNLSMDHFMFMNYYFNKFLKLKLVFFMNIFYVDLRLPWIRPKNNSLNIWFILFLFD